jgi:hypothetical protein
LSRRLTVAPRIRATGSSTAFRGCEFKFFLVALKMKPPFYTGYEGGEGALAKADTHPKFAAASGKKLSSMSAKPHTHCAWRYKWHKQQIPMNNDTGPDQDWSGVNPSSSIALRFLQ